MDTMPADKLTRRRFILGTAAASLGVLAACAPQAATPPAKPASETKPAESKPPAEAKPKPAAPAAGKAGGELKFGLSSDPPNLDPHVTTGTAAMNVKMMVYNGLVRYWRKAEIVPDLAESWSAPDDRTYAFKLRTGVTFHDGTELTAADVKASLERILDPKVGATKRADFQDVKEIQAEGDTVRLVLGKPNAALIAHLARPECAILPEKAIKSGVDFNTTMLGTGPFKLTAREPGVRTVVEKNPNYFRQGLPKLERIVFVPYQDENTRVTAIKAGDVDLIEYVPWKDTVPLQQEPNIEVYSGDASAFMTLMFNVRQKPFDDPRVRRAFGYAVNRQGIIDIVFFGRGSIMSGGVIPQGYWAYNPSLEGTWSYDPDKAKALLKEAGYGDGLQVKLTATSQYGMHQGSGEVVQADLKKIGVQADLELFDWATTTEKRNKGEYQFLVHGLATDITDPDFLTPFFVTDGFYGKSTGFGDPEIDRMLAEGRSIQDQEKRKPIYLEIEKRVLELAPWAYLSWREQSEAALKKVQGYEHLPGGLGFLSGITLEEVSIEG
jgi:glutathione transport system substrate-binding protein